MPEEFAVIHTESEQIGVMIRASGSESRWVVMWDVRKYRDKQPILFQPWRDTFKSEVHRAEDCPK